MTATELFLQNKGLIKHTAYKISRQYNVEHEELICQGNYIFYLAYIKNKNINTFQPFLRKCLHQELNHYAKYLCNNIFDEIPESIPYVCNFDSFGIENFDGFSKEAKEIIEIIFSEMLFKKRYIRKELLSRNWKPKQIKFHFQEIKIKLEGKTNDSRTN